MLRLRALLRAVIAFAAIGLSCVAALPVGVRLVDLPTGSRLAVLDIRPSGAPSGTVVFLHGGPGAHQVRYAATNREVLAYYRGLAHAGLRVILYDQAGSGLSEHLVDPTQYTVARHVADLEALRAWADAPRLRLVGDSWGATLAANYMAVHPQRVTRVVFTSPGMIDASEWGRDPTDVTWRLPPTNLRRLEELRASPLVARLEETLARHGATVAARLVPEAELDAWEDSTIAAILPAAVCDVRALPPGLLATGNGFWANHATNYDHLHGSSHPRAELRNNRTPALILRGECDYIRPEVAAQYASTLPNSRFLHIEGAGHILSLERPDVYATIIRPFLLGRPIANGKEP